MQKFIGKIIFLLSILLGTIIVSADDVAPATTATAVAPPTASQNNSATANSTEKKPVKKLIASKTVIEEHENEEDVVSNKANGILLYHPNYILPAYYSESTYQALYMNDIPNNQHINNLELKFQLSFQLPIIQDLFSQKNSLHLAYTQDSFWQSYVDSPYFRETNYEPELYFHRVETSWLAWQSGFIHQSNGRGGLLERTWNRYYGEVTFSDTNWLFDVKGWGLLDQGGIFATNNPDISLYLGNEQLLFSYKIGANVLSFMARNTVESHFARAAEEYTWSFPLYQRLRGYVYVFNGYGPDLIEYNQQQLAVGVGISLNDWI